MAMTVNQVSHDGAVVTRVRVLIRWHDGHVATIVGARPNSTMVASGEASSDFIVVDVVVVVVIVVLGTAGGEGGAGCCGSG
jgi:hypothetical protein